MVSPSMIRNTKPYGAKTFRMSPARERLRINKISPCGLFAGLYMLRGGSTIEGVEVLQNVRIVTIKKEPKRMSARPLCPTAIHSE